MHKQTIGHVLHRLDLAGAEVLAAALARKLADQYHFVFLCLDGTGSQAADLENDGFTSIDLKRKPGVDIKVAWRLREAVRRYRIDLLHAHQYTPFFYAALSRGLGNRPRILFTEHGRHYPDYRRSKRVLANRFLLKRTDRVTAVGQFVKNMVVENEGIESRRIQVIYNGIDSAKFNTTTAYREQARELLQVDQDQPIVMQVARFHSVKDHQTAIKAFDNVLKIVDNALLMLVGDGEERAASETLVQSLGISENVRFLGLRNDINTILPAADIFMLSSLSEGISVTLLEAMACTLPIVATDVGGNGEVVQHEVSGLLSPRGDWQQLAQNLAILLQNPRMRQGMAAAGHQRLQQHFTQSRMHDSYVSIYQQMLERT